MLDKSHVGVWLESVQQASRLGRHRPKLSDSHSTNQGLVVRFQQVLAWLPAVRDTGKCPIWLVWLLVLIQLEFHFPGKHVADS